MWRRGGSHAGAAWPDNAPSGKRTTVIAVSPHWRAPAAVALAASREREIEQKGERERERREHAGGGEEGARSCAAPLVHSVAVRIDRERERAERRRRRASGSELGTIGKGKKLQGEAGATVYICLTRF